jgi:Flp pilus assembly protein TadD
MAVIMYGLGGLGAIIVAYYMVLALIRGFQFQALEIQLRRQIGRRDYRQALETIQKALRISPTYTGIYFQRAVVYAALGDFLSAEADYTTSLKFTPNAPGYAGRAAARLALGQLNEALIDANHVIACSRLWWRGYYERGRVYAALGHLQIALDDFEQALALNQAAPDEVLLAQATLAARLESGQ